MPALQNLVLTDRAATPVAHTFTPRHREGDVGTVAESSGVPAGDARVTVSLGKPNANGRRKPTLKFTFPVIVTETINGVQVPKIARVAYADLSFNFDEMSTETERNNVVGMVQSALNTGANQALVNDTVVKLQGVY